MTSSPSGCGSTGIITKHLRCSQKVVLRRLERFFYGIAGKPTLNWPCATFDCNVGALINTHIGCSRCIDDWCCCRVVPVRAKTTTWNVILDGKTWSGNRLDLHGEQFKQRKRINRNAVTNTVPGILVDQEVKDYYFFVLSCNWNIR